jgi:nitrate/nitrite-specific signal transduction histidine kinase
MLRIAQEALHNALQHAQAKNIEVVIQSSSAGSVQITIADDGRGMADAERYKDNHYGFENMERRAADSALSLLVESAPGNGTRIVVATTS